jgi:hypothetical protein
MEGWGAHAGDLIAHGVWSDQGQLHINQLELEAVRLALEQFADHLPKGHVRIVSDNASVVAAINHQGGTHSQALSLAVESIWLWAHARDVHLSTRHLSGVPNVLADALSRPGSILQTEWTLCHKVLHRVWEVWDKPMIDLFATRFNSRLQLYVSPVPDPRAWTVDAFSISWRGLDTYTFPPLALIGRVLSKVESDQPRMILVAPLWESRPWFPLLKQLARAPALDLRLQVGELVQPRSGLAHGNPAGLQLHAWLL